MHNEITTIFIPAFHTVLISAPLKKVRSHTVWSVKLIMTTDNEK